MGDAKAFTCNSPYEYPDQASYPHDSRSNSLTLMLRLSHRWPISGWPKPMHARNWRRNG